MSIEDTTQNIVRNLAAIKGRQGRVITQPMLSVQQGGSGTKIILKIKLAQKKCELKKKGRKNAQNPVVTEWMEGSKGRGLVPNGHHWVPTGYHWVPVGTSGYPFI